MGDLMKYEGSLLTEEQAGMMSVIVKEMMAPVMEQIAGILERNNQAMERIAATQQMLSSRISDLEKQVRLKTPMSKSQEKYVNDAIRARARALLNNKGYADDRKAVTKLGTAIRKSVLTRYGVNSLREAPAYDYETAIQIVNGWNDLLVLRDVVKEAKKREEEVMAAAEPSADVDVPAALEEMDHQSCQPDRHPGHSGI